MLQRSSFLFNNVALNSFAIGCKCKDTSFFAIPVTTFIFLSRPVVAVVSTWKTRYFVLFFRSTDFHLLQKFVVTVFFFANENLKAFHIQE